MNTHRLLTHRFPEVSHAYDESFSILYALSIGLGRAPMDERRLRYVCEDRLEAFPTMAAVLATPGFWAQDPQFEIDWKRGLHGEQELEIHTDLPAAGELIGSLRIVAIDDKGADTGALIHSERTLRDAATGTLVATLRQSTFARGDGGFGGERGGNTHAWTRPSAAPDVVWDVQTQPDSALLYRLTGDRNPVHSNPGVAREAGFDAPILHGLCTFGMIAQSLA